MKLQKFPSKHCAWMVIIAKKSSTGSLKQDSYMWTTEKSVGLGGLSTVQNYATYKVEVKVSIYFARQYWWCSFSATFFTETDYHLSLPHTCNCLIPKKLFFRNNRAFYTISFSENFWGAESLSKSISTCYGIPTITNRNNNFLLITMDSLTANRTYWWALINQFSHLFWN